MAASTYNFTDGSLGGQIIPPNTQTCENNTTVLRNILDFSSQNLDAGEGDIAVALNIPAGTTVLNSFIRVMTADDANATVDLGYTGAVATWGDGVALSTADVIVGNTGTAAYFKTAGTIIVTATTDTADVDITKAKVEVVANCLESLDVY